uniref:WGS project CAEQ00000000 data, annotated contig 934 n=1 Tax=Trypanosoma congolense (strain IL3000) TaxID=1068625 RepID=F9WJP6_TRYCI|nr:unnamed protein product [Trypanosoma congolense IL3000]
MVRKIRYNRPKTSPPERLIDFLCSRFPYLTRRAWEEHIHDGYVTVVTAMVTSSGGGGPVHCGQLMPSDYELQQKDEVHFNPPRELEPEVDETVVTIYSDNVIVVCIKNGNLPVAEGGRYSLNTLVGLLQRKNLLTKVDGCGSGGGVSAANSRGDKGSDSTCAYFPVHRLDKETSGLVVLAKTQDAARFLSLLFERQTELLSAEVGKGMEAQCFDSPAVLSWFEGLLAMDKTVVKSYIALLQGEAPEGSCFVVTDRIGLLWDEVRENVTESEKHVKLKKLKMACYPSLPTKPQQHGRPACSRVRNPHHCAILGYL